MANHTPDLLPPPQLGYLYLPNRVIIDRYIFTPCIFEVIEGITHGAGGELQLTNAIKTLLKFEKGHGYRYEGNQRQARIPECDGRVRPEAPTAWGGFS